MKSISYPHEKTAQTAVSSSTRLCRPSSAARQWLKARGATVATAVRRHSLSAHCR
ncbi:hypothetical protein [Alloprevotella sp. OH1205_COT-284]|uniref:hypothetical protein n=1 Tax=Alloprevotella sp. OH1205_COT-284 TaxID=2491043 RepID=UPI0013152D8D|nr:hypothetical protein [Alloprevotella sp. OH1205_COT-284]